MLAWPSLSFAISMFPYETWHFPIILWKRIKIYLKKLPIDCLSLTDYEQSSNLIFWPLFNDPSQFMGPIPFFRIHCFHVGTLLYKGALHSNYMPQSYLGVTFYLSLPCAYIKMWPLSYKISNKVINMSIPFLFGKISWGDEKKMIFKLGLITFKTNKTDDDNSF